MTRKVLLAWEFGAGFEHVMLLAGVLRCMRELVEDVELVFAIRDPEAGLQVGLPFESVIQSPKMMPKPGYTLGAKLQPRTTHGEVMCDIFTGEQRDGDRYFAEWNELINRIRPDAIVSDYSPGVTMLARGRFPVVAVGNGYTLPPVNVPVFPPVSKARYPSLGTEPELVERLNAVLARAGAKLLDRLPQMNEAAAYGLATLPVFDPYADYPGRDWIGIQTPGGIPEAADTAEGGLAYFNERHQVEDDLIDALVGSGIAIDAFMGAPLRRTRKRVQGSAVHFSEEHFELAKALPGKAVAIHSGSLGLSSAAAYAGVPQVILPKHQENHVNARGIVAAGAGVKVQPAKRKAGELAAIIRDAAESEAMRRAARALAVSLDPWRKADPARTIAERTLALIG